MNVFITRFLVIDVGMGTQDILLFDSERNIENCVKMVLPSQTQIPFRFAAPFGDMMLTGCFGLTDAYINHAGD